jgi:hypothetical protein
MLHSHAFACRVSESRNPGPLQDGCRSGVWVSNRNRCVHTSVQEAAEVLKEVSGKGERLLLFHLRE